jgi:uncharacterized protein (TIGR02265 family)
VSPCTGYIVGGRNGTSVIGKVKGNLLIARLKYLRAQGVDSTERVFRRLSQEDRQVISEALVPDSWYPAGVLLRLETTIAALLALGDRHQLFRDMGRFSAEANLGPSGVQRPYLREGDPQFLLAHLPKIYGSQHDTGRREYLKTGERSAVVRTLDAGETSVDDCLTTVGWLQRAVELSGGRAVRVVEQECRARGSAHCEYHCEWQ